MTKQLRNDLNINRIIPIENENSNAFICKIIYQGDDNYNEDCYFAYIEFNKKTLGTLLELKEDMKQAINRVSAKGYKLELAVPNMVKILDGDLAKQAEEHYDTLDEDGIVPVESITINIEHDAFNAGGVACIDEYGLNIKAYNRYDYTEFIQAHAFSWDWLEEIYNTMG